MARRIQDRSGTNKVHAEAEAYREALDASGAACVVTDRRGVVRAMSARAAERLGTSARSAVGRPLVASVSVTDAGGRRVELDRAVTHAELFVEGGGAQRSVRLRLARRLAGWRCVWMVDDDASPEQEAERERAKVAELLRADRAKDRFIAILAHDLRAPLSAVLGWTQLMRREMLDRETTERALATIERNVRTQAALIARLLDVSRMSSGRLHLEAAPCDVGAVVRHVVEAMRPSAVAAGLRLVCLSPGAPATVSGDRHRLEQVTTNLVANALKFTPPGGSVAVTVSRERDHVRLDVRDTGKGIAPERLPLVLERFGVDEPDQSSGSGLGLGLYIVRRIVELHGGSVRVHSEGEGRGAVFTVLLPACDAVMAPPSSVSVLVELGELDGVRILVVDDDEDALAVLVELLRARGADVVSARGVASALAAADISTPDIVVSDLGLPDGDGCELLQRLRAARPRLRGVAVSGFASEADVARAVQSGFDHHVAKPIDSASLVARLRRLVGRE